MLIRVVLIVTVAFSIGVLGAIFLRQTDQSGVAQSGKALIGGPFTLTNQNGQTVTEKTFRGKYMLVTFGYTYCPDICPAELNVISAAMEKIGNKAGEIVPIFITIDPKRDTVEQIETYMSSFHPQMVGLTGNEEQIKQAASAYRVYYQKADGGPGDDSYLMDHSTFMYLMDPKGDYVSHFGYGISAEDLAARISNAMNEAA